MMDTKVRLRGQTYIHFFEGLEEEKKNHQKKYYM